LNLYATHVGVQSRRANAGTLAASLNRGWRAPFLCGFGVKFMPSLFVFHNPLHQKVARTKRFLAFSSSRKENAITLICFAKCAPFPFEPNRVARLINPISHPSHSLHLSKPSRFKTSKLTLLLQESFFWCGYFWHSFASTFLGAFKRQFAPSPSIQSHPSFVPILP